MVNEVEYLDVALNFLYSKRGSHTVSNNLIEVFKNNNLTEPTGNLEILLRFHTEGIADLLAANPLDTFGKNLFSISSKGIQFIESLPLEYKNKPYTYRLKLEQEENRKQKEKDDLDAKVKMLTLSQSKFQKGVTIASLLVAAIALFTPFVIRVLDRDEIKATKTEVPQLQKLIRGQEQLSKDLQGLKMIYFQDSSKMKKAYNK